jgi:O-antigen/teichoic acid export membrane protein
LIKPFIQKIFTSRFIKSSILVSISKVISSLSNLVFMVYAVNLISKTENGYLQYYLGFLPILLAVAELGIPSAIVKYLSPITHDLEEMGILMEATLYIKLSSFLILAIVGILSFFLFGLDPLILFILIIGGTVTSFLTYFESILISYRNYTSLAIWNPMGNLTKLGLLFMCSTYFPYPMGYLDILVIFSISPIFILGFFFYLLRKNEFNWTGNFQKVILRLKELSLFNLWAFLASIFAILSDRMEIFFLKIYHNPEAVAVYGTTLQLFSGFVILFSTLNSLVLPRLAIAPNQAEFNRLLLKAFFMSLLVAILLIPGYFLAEPILNFLFKNKYSESIPIFKILYPNYLLQLLFAPLGVALFAMGKPKILAMLAFIRMVSGVILDTILIPEYSAAGAGISFFLGQIISWLVLLGYFWATLWK